MFVSFQLPITDLRPFLAATHGRLTRPAWPYAQEGQDYIRSFGQVRRRLRGGLVEWDGEQRFCSADHAIKISSYDYLREKGLRLIHRRLYRIAEYASRVEVGFKAMPYRKVIKDLDAVLAAQIETPCRKSPVKLCNAEKAVVLQYLLSTTKRVSGKCHPYEAWWIAPGAKQLVVEYVGRPGTAWGEPQEITTFPRYTVQIAEFEEMTVHHCWLNCGNQPVSTWFLGSGPLYEKICRRYRLNIARIHSEYESLKCVLRDIAQGRLAIAPRTALADSLTKYLRGSIKFLLRPPKSIVGDSSPLVQTLAMTDLILPGERQNLLKNLSGLRPNIVKMVEEVTKPGRLQDSGLQVITQNAFFGSVTMSDQSVKISGNNITVGNVTVASTIQGSYNHVEKSGASADLKALLETLHSDVAKMATKLPPASAEAAARDLQSFSAEAVSPSPRKSFLQVTASGLIEAAKAVAELAGPIMTSVKTILTIFGIS